MNPVKCWKCGVRCTFLAQGDKNVERKHKTIQYLRSTFMWGVAWWLVVHSDMLENA